MLTADGSVEAVKPWQFCVRQAEERGLTNRRRFTSKHASCQSKRMAVYSFCPRKTNSFQKTLSTQNG